MFAVSIALLSCPTLSHASTRPTEVVPMGNNTFSITRAASNGFNRDIDKLKAEAQDEAAKYCAAEGKQLKVVDLTSKRPFFGTGYASATIVFQALTAAEITQQANAAPGIVEKNHDTDSMYNDLMKLDDLRKKGILTDDEFQAEKKKILARSK